jgi:hypothetical protein
MAKIAKFSKAKEQELRSNPILSKSIPIKPSAAFEKIVG